MLDANLDSSVAFIVLALHSLYKSYRLDVLSDTFSMIYGTLVLVWVECSYNIFENLCTLACFAL